jgi:hypothetical protein
MSHAKQLHNAEARTISFTDMGAHHRLLRLLQRRSQNPKKVLLSTTYVTYITGDW